MSCGKLITYAPSFIFTSFSSKISKPTLSPIPTPTSVLRGIYTV